jgi:hypothetical protein
MKILLIIYVSILVISVHISMIIASEPYQSHSEQLTQLMNWMTGSFSSEERAEIDTSYYNVSLYMTRIWNENSDGFWIYVEQALATNLERPYRQRIYQLAQKDDSTFESRVYLLPNAIRFAGAWKSPKVFDKLTPDSLTLGMVVQLSSLGRMGIHSRVSQLIKNVKAVCVGHPMRPLKSAYSKTS